MIDSYSFGHIVVDGKSFDSDVIILPDRVVSWWRGESHVCTVADLSAIEDEQFDVLVIGTGASGMMKVRDEVLEHFSKKGVKVFVKDTKAAAKAYNAISGKKAVAALHLTC